MKFIPNSPNHSFNKTHRWLKQQHMEMLNRPHALQVTPIAKPDHIPIPAIPHESLSHERLNLSSTRGQQIISRRIRRKREFRPNDEVDDPSVEAVGPIVAKNLPVVYPFGSFVSIGDLTCRPKYESIGREKKNDLHWHANLPSLCLISPPSFHPNLSSRMNRIILPYLFTTPLSPFPVLP